MEKTINQIVENQNKIIKTQDSLINHVLFIYKLIAFFVFWIILLFLISPFLLKGWGWFNDLSEGWKIFLLGIPAYIIVDLSLCILKKFIKLK